MKARLRDHLPRRFQNAVILARRALQCERLESRCLMHALPLVSAYEADQGDSLPADQTQPVPALIEQPSSQVPVKACDASAGTDVATSAPTRKVEDTAKGGGTLGGGTLGDVHSDAPPASLIQTAAPVGARAAGAADKKNPDESDPMGGLRGEGEGVPSIESPGAKGGNGSFNRGSTSSDSTGDTVPARASAPLGDLNNSVPVGRVTSPHNTKIDAGAVSARPTPSTGSDLSLTSPLGLPGDEASSSAGKVTNSSSSVGLSLSPDVQMHKGLSQSTLSPSLQSQSLPGRSLQSQGAASSLWLFSSFQPGSTAANAHGMFASDGHVIDAMRAMSSDDDADVRAARLLNDSSDSDVLQDEAAEGSTQGSYALRAAMQRSQDRQAKRARDANGLRHLAVRHARGYALPSYLRVREGNDGLVELAIEPPQRNNNDGDAYPREPARATSQRNWNDASMGLYREFDLASADEPTVSVAEPDPLPLETSGLVTGDQEILDAIDAAHAEGESGESAAGSVREAALPLGLLTLSSLLAISRHRFGRKGRGESHE